MKRIIRAALVVATAATAAIIPTATADAANASNVANMSAAAQSAPLGGHLTIGFVYGDEGYDTDPFWRGEFNATSVVSFGAKLPISSMLDSDMS